MAEAALDYDYDETLEISEGGIADFLTAKTGSWADDDIPSSGIAQVKHVVDQLAEYGRFDDEYMVHAAPNETVVPLPVLDANPRLRLALYAQMRALGLDPERYTVGNDLNSINPVTGQREFGIGKKIKKFFKKVVKVIKKVVPIILPIVLSMTPLGPIFGSMLGSGIATLMQGGDFKDALKSAALSGVTAGIFKGVQGGLQGARAGTGFGQGFKSSVGEALRPFAAEAGASAALQEQIVDNLVDPNVSVTPGSMDVSMDIPMPAQAGVTPTGPPVTEMGLATPDVMARQTLEPLSQILPQTTAAAYPAQNVINAATTPTAAGVTGAGTTGAGTTVPSLPMLETKLSPYSLPEADFESLPGLGDAGAGTGTGVSGAGGVTPPTDAFPDLQAAIAEQQQPGFFKNLKDKQYWEAFSPSGPTRQELWAKYFPESTELTGKQRGFIEAVLKAKGVTPSILQRYGPILGATMLASRAAAGAEEEEPESLFETGITGADLLAENPEDYMVSMNLPPPITIQQWGDTGVGPQPTIQWAPTGAAGGDVDSYPPRIGGINGPGTGTSDDVPAMLSDGEFVFTAKAVKGAGNGSRKSGTSNLYNLMRNFEGRM